jgi:hypothetical protein
MLLWCASFKNVQISDLLGGQQYIKITFMIYRIFSNLIMSDDGESDE